MVILMGVEMFHSKKTDQDYYKIHLAKSGQKGIKGLGVDSPFCMESAFLQFKEEDSGKEIEPDWGYDENGYLKIKGYKIIQKGGK